MRVKRPRWRVGLLASVCACACAFAAAPATAQHPLPFAGRWLQDEAQPSPGALSILTIKDGSLSWSGPKKSDGICKQAYVLKPERPGTVYANARGTKFIAGVAGSLPTYLLTLGAGDCASLAQEVRISYPLVYDIRHIEVIEYVNGKPVGARRFHRKK